MGPKPIETVLREVTPSLMALPGVVGTGQGLCEGTPCIKVLVARSTAILRRRIPTDVEGYKVIVQQSGELHAISRRAERR